MRPSDDHRLAEVLADAVSDVEPRDRLHQIRARTARSATRPRHSGLLAAGAALATAAVVTTVAAVGGFPGSAPETGEGATASSAPPSNQPSPSPSVSESPPELTAIPVYYVGDTPSGPRLFREFQSVPAAQDRVLAALNAALAGSPLDPDYLTLWSGLARGVDAYAAPDAANQNTILVDLIPEVPTGLPAGMSRTEATLALQQLVFTAQGALGTRAPVVFRVDGEPRGTVLGVDTTRPLAHDPRRLALVNITSPAEGAAVTSGTLVASGVASSFEATVPWQVLDASGAVALEGFATAEGWLDRLYPWATSVDVSGLAPGSYTFLARTDDPSDGEGPGPHVDSKTFTIG